jgi:primosomal replication protein N
LNKLELIAQVAEISPLRYTPAGIPLLSLVLRHLSEQIEAGMKRRVECDINAVVLGELAQQAQHLALDTTLQVSGFLAKRSLKSTQLVLHLTTLNII